MQNAKCDSSVNYAGFVFSNFAPDRSPDYRSQAVGFSAGAIYLPKLYSFESFLNRPEFNSLKSLGKTHAHLGLLVTNELYIKNISIYGSN